MNAVRRHIPLLALVALVGALLLPGLADAAAVRSGFNSNTLPANDDGSTGLVPVGFTMDFFGIIRSGVYVNNNGNITLDSALSTYTPFNISSANREIIAPFFGDVDTRSNSSPVTYGTGTVNGRAAFGANWVNVNCYSANSRTVRNSFQVVLIERSDTGPNNFDFELNIDQIQWEAGQASGGNSNCQGGSPARVGYSNGTTANSFELPGSGVVGAFLDSGPAATSLIQNSLNSSVLGRYTFNARNGVINTAPTISNIADQTINNDTTTGALAFTVGDGQDSASSLTVTASSSNSTLCPSSSCLTLGGSGASRTITATPAAGQTGTATITVTVTDSGGLTATDTFLLTVNQSSFPPNCSGSGSGTFNVTVTQPFSTSFTGTNLTGGTMTVAKLSLPAASTLSPTSGTAPLSTTFSWTPGSADYGQTYSGTIRYTNDFGQTGDCPLVLIVAGNVAPVAQANGPYTGSKSSTTTVNAAGSTDSDGTIVSYEWDCNGDGTFAAATTSVNYACPAFTLGGTYTATVRVTDNQGATDTDSATITVPNVGPTAEANGPYTVNQTAGNTSASVTITSTGSVDGDGGALTYGWDCDTSNGTTYSSNTTTVSCSYGDDGPRTGSLRVCDPEGLCDTDSFTVNVTNTAPVADAGGPYTTNQGVAVTLNGNASSDADGGITTYQWDCDANGGLSFSSPSASPTFSCTYPDDGTFTATLRVTDVDGTTDDDTAQVVVTNTVPIADAGGPYSGTKNVALTVNGSGSTDSDGTIASYQWDCDTSDSVPVSSPSATATFSCIYLAVGTYTVQLIVTDDDGSTDSDTATVSIVNTGPVANAGGPYAAIQGAAVTVDGSLSSDSDGVIVTYEWDCDINSGPGYSTPATSPTFLCSYATTGTFTVRLRVTDDDGAQDTAVATVSSSNQPPVAEAGGPYIGGQGTATPVYAFGSVDPDGSIVLYEWDCDGNGTYEVSTTSQTGTSCTYATIGTYTVTLRVTDSDGATATDTAQITIGNQLPIADAGGPYAALQQTTVTIDGSGSTDLDGTLTNYGWDCDSSDGISLTSTGTTASTFCTYASVGTYTVTLTVTDDDGDTDTATTQVIVSNGAPVAVAGGPYTGNKGTAIAVDGTASSDADGVIVSYAWDCDNDGTADVTNSSGIATCTYATIGTYTITLTVTDNDGATASDVGTINVPLVGPIADAGGPYAGTQGSGVQVNGSASFDSDGVIVLWEWDCDGDGVFELSSSSVPTATCTYTTVGTYTVQLRVTDDDGVQDVDVATATAANLLPVANAGGPYTGSESQPVLVDGSGSADLDGFIATYGWDCDGDLIPDVITSSATGATCTFIATGTYTITLIVTDSDGGTDSDSATVIIASTPPTADAGGPYSGDEGTPIAVDGTASTDVGGTIVQWEWDCDSDGTYDVVSIAGVGSTCEYADEGNFVVTLRVTDDDGDTAVDVANVAVSNVNPALTGPLGPITGDEGQQLSWSAAATDLGLNDSLTYSWTFGDGNTGSGVNVSHTYVNEGTYVVTVTVDDGDGGTDTNSVTVTISNVAPVLGQTTVPNSANEGQLISPTTSATDVGVADTLTFVWDMGDGNILNGANISYTYPDDGVFTVTVTVSDDSGATDSFSSVINVINVDPTIDSLTGDTTGFEGQLLSWSVTASDVGIADTLTYAWDFGDGGTATGTQADHAYADEGQYVVEITVTDDDGGSVSQILAVTISNVAPVIDSVTVTPGDEGTSIPMSVVASDAGTFDVITYTWDFGDSVIGTGASVSHTYTDDGIYFVTVTAMDDDGDFSTATVELFVSNVDPVITSMLAIPSANPEEGDEIDLDAMATDQGIDDIPDLVYTWDVGDGSPVITGQDIEHTFADDGVYLVVLTVEDGDGGVDTQTLEITVDNVDPVISTSPPVNALQDELYSYVPEVQDPGDEVFTWTLSASAPAAMTIDASTGELAWTPDYDDYLTGSFSLVLTVDDGDGGQDQQAWTITVFSTDSDGDGIPDDWEDANGLDKFDPVDAGDDPDGDGLTNLNEFIFGQDPWVYDGPSAPIAISPIGGVEVTEVSPDLLVQNATDPQGEALLYDFELYLDENLTQFVTAGYGVIEDQSGETFWKVDLQLTEDQEYWWIARANDPWIDGPWTDAESFILNQFNDPPEVPVLIYPLDGQIVTSLEPTFEWELTEDPNEDEVTYDVNVFEIDGETLVASITGVLDSGNSTTTWMSDVVLADNSDYLWTARAVDDEGLAGDWAELEEFFVTSENEAPDTPTWVSPDDLSQVETQSPNLVATEVTDPENQEISYRFELDLESTFDSAAYIDNTVPATETGTVWWDLAVDARILDENAWWYAKVTAIDSDGIESAPALISFFVRGPNDAPDLPTLISPEDGSTQDAEYVVLVLGLAEDIESDEVFYDFILARDAGLSDIVFEADGVVAGAGPLGAEDNSTVEVPFDLEREAEYFWSARSVDDRGAVSEYQVPFRFVTDGDPGQVDPVDPDGYTAGVGACSACQSSVIGADAPAAVWLLALVPAALVLGGRGY